MKASRLIATLHSPDYRTQVKVRYSTEWQEYSCHLYRMNLLDQWEGDEETTYYTDERKDALTTAKILAN